MTNKTIGVFFGSRNPEHDVSIITGQLIIDGLKKLGYNVIPVYISKQGKWYIDTRLDNLKFFKDPNYLLKLQSIPASFLDLEKSQGKKQIQQKGILGKKTIIDLAFPAFHGQNGEDGTIQGLFELINIPYVGCDVASSAIAMDKVLTKLMYKAQNIPTVDFVYLGLPEWKANREEVMKKIKKELKLPLIVKPARLGSSIGINKVKTEKDLEFAIEVAFHFDSKVIVEKCIDDLMDITCCVIGNDDPLPSLLQESVFDGGFFSYEDKYLKDGGAQLGKAKKSIIIPATLDSKITKEIQQAAVEIYKLVGCSGIARVDFLYDKKTKKWFANEINTLPGTLYHHLWKKSGVEFSDLLIRLIKYAEEKFEQKKEITTTFESNILTHVNSKKLALKGS